MDSPILVGIDAREQSADALAVARLLAGALGRRLALAHVVTPTPPGWGGVELERIIKREGHELLARTAARLGNGAVEQHVVEWPSTASALHDLAEKLDASAVVVGSCHRGMLGRLVLGSVGHGLITGAPCSVAVAPPGYRAPDAIRLVGVAYDGSAESDEAIDVAVQIARGSGAELRLWFVVAPTGLGGATPERYAELTAYMHEWAAKRLARGLDRVPEGVTATPEVLEGETAEAIAEAAAAADIVVCGSRGYGPLRRVMAGSTARRLMDIAPCPVILVPRPAGGEA